MSGSDEVVRRRMAATGESYATAVQTVAALNKLLDADIRQDWIAEWISDQAWTPNEEAVRWLRDRPKNLRPLMVRFPPACVVVAKVPLRIPAPGTAGVVRSWFESGHVGVSQHPDGLVRAKCSSDDLEVLACWRGWTPDRVRFVFSGMRER